MRITDLLKKSGIALGVKVADKSEAIDKLVSLHEKCGNLKDVKAYKEGILKRETLISVKQLKLIIHQEPDA